MDNHKIHVPNQQADNQQAARSQHLGISLDFNKLNKLELLIVMFTFSNKELMAFSMTPILMVISTGG